MACKQGSGAESPMYGPMTAQQYMTGGAFGQSGFEGGGDSLFGDWNQQSTSNLFKGIGTGANIFFGAKNLSMAKKNLAMQQDQHRAWMEDRDEAKARRDAVAKIRF